ncbi:MAG: hypothetical protein HYY06_07400 [Deltaproteobacteria bacterium]|nr:hypothetical protein [Deltaproteobacteria bacterium]
MARLNLTLDDVTLQALERDARKAHVRTATHARRLLREALEEHARRERRLRWAEAYRADREDAKKLLAEMEAGELDLLENEDD